MARKQYHIPKVIPPFIAILFVVFTNGVQTEMESLYKTVCSHHKLVITCPYYHKIAIKRLYYGIKPNAVCNNRSLITTGRLPMCCRGGPQDCIVLDASQYSNYTIYCSGYRTCDRKVAAVKSLSTCSKPNQETHYQQVVYHCVQAMEKEDYVIVECHEDGVVVPQPKDKYPLLDKNDGFDSSGDKPGTEPTSSVATIREGKSENDDEGNEEISLTKLE
ncbi:Hypothetical predicted protein [Octopus vulgaris]|uniref:Uncharacterized protein n=1 Tax=Octopus vulgaris TaxID=6645 RepID=A0AA36BUD1_OCTVU|nr:Hypothetical predicted protein [Octopus vulgaris]